MAHIFAVRALSHSHRQGPDSNMRQPHLTRSACLSQPSAMRAAAMCP